MKTAEAKVIGCAPYKSTGETTSAMSRQQTRNLNFSSISV
jgi:hypothetical protein